MKELSIEEKARNYDKAREKIAIRFGSNVADEIFSQFEMSEDEKIRKAIRTLILSASREQTTIVGVTQSDMFAWLEKQSTPQVRTGLEWVNTIDDACDKRYLEEYAHGEYCHEQSFKWGFQEGVDWLEKQGTSYTKKDIEDAYLKGVTDTKNEIEKQYEANYQIRKDIATFIFNYKGDIKDRAKWIDYLGIKVSFVEKQDEQKPNPCDSCVNRKGCINCENGELRETEQKPTDKVEPKFHEGEWITNGDYTWQIVSVTDLDYILQSQDGNTVDDTISHVDEQFHSFTIEDAKDGDVLYSPCLKLLWIYNKDGKTCYVGSNLNYNSCSIVSSKPIFIPTDVQPATKEQRDQLEKAMADAGYTFDFEKKELRKIEQRSADKLELKKIEWNDCKTCGFRTLAYKQNTAWSEEDEAALGDALWCCKQAASIAKDENDMGNVWYAETWLKSLKNRVQPKQEWSEQEQVRINRIVAYLENLNVADNDILLKDVEWLKSLKDRVQPHPKQEWSEDDENMIKRIKEYLNIAIGDLSNKLNCRIVTIGNSEYSSMMFDISECISWLEVRLKSLRPQSQWKPSDEQMEALYLAAMRGDEPKYTFLVKLYKDLKKLREE